MPQVLVWDIETMPDLRGFAAANALDGKSDDEVRASRRTQVAKRDHTGPSFTTCAVLGRRGDEVSINADFISVEQAVVTLEIENALYNSEIEIEAVTLTTDKARELARALLSVVEAIEFVRTPTNLLRLDRKSHPAAEHEPRYPLLMQFSPSLSAIKNSLITPASRLRTRQNVMANEGAERLRASQLLDQRTRQKKAG